MIFYRYQDYHKHEGGIEIDIVEFFLLRETKCGYWILPAWSKPYSDEAKEKYKKWISKNSQKRYAYPTKKEAAWNLFRRKKSQVEHCTYFLDRAKTAKILAEKLVEDLGKEDTA